MNVFKEEKCFQMKSVKLSMYQLHSLECKSHTSSPLPYP
uniref:Uncharacterized protein n=1 Tax=Rhizophora mucronata TaxID=61149 RepID=A0A2P2PZA4_RHIMU